MPESNPLRAAAAAEIAALIAGSGTPWQTAREQVLAAMRRTHGRIPASSLPTAAEVESAVRGWYAIFEPEQHAGVLAGKRHLALELMRTCLSGFDVWLTGSVLNGAAHAMSNIDLAVFCDDVKAVEVALLDAGIDFECLEPAGGAMPEPLESLGFLTDPGPGSRALEGVRIDIWPTTARARNPYAARADRHQQPWEALGRIDARALEQALAQNG